MPYATITLDGEVTPTPETPHHHALCDLCRDTDRLGVPWTELTAPGADGYDQYGYRRDASSSYGTDRYGLTHLARFGYDEDGYDRDGYDRSGFDEEGYDREGYDRS